MEVFTGVERRHRWSLEKKLQISEEASAPGSSEALASVDTTSSGH